MRKEIYRVLGISLLFLLSLAPVWAAPSRTAMPVVIKDAGGYQPTEDVAYVDANEILVGMSTLQNYLDSSAAYRPEEKDIVVTLAAGRLTTTNPAVKQQIAGPVKVAFPAKIVNGQPYLDLASLDTVLGIDIQFDYNGQLILEAHSKKIGPYEVSPPEKKGIPGGKINLVWDVKANTANLTADTTSLGANVLSPTWFAVVSGSGLISNKDADPAYVDLAHSRGGKVWALITNSFDPELTHELLYNQASQNQMLAQLLVYAAYYHLDGINLDFENVYDQDRDALAAFVEKFSNVLNRQNLVASADVTVPSNVSNWSLCYDRARMAKAVDYMMVMTYDEHWSKSPISGSVASLGWVTAGVDKTLQSVPREKLLLGLPFYTREWEERQDDYGNIRVRSKSLSMDEVEAMVKKQHLTLQWLNDMGQYYTEYENDGRRYRIWLEEDRSIGLKADLVSRYQLAGVASWRKGFEKKSIWPVLQEKLSR